MESRRPSKAFEIAKTSKTETPAVLANVFPPFNTFITAESCPLEVNPAFASATSTAVPTPLLGSTPPKDPLSDVVPPL